MARGAAEPVQTYSIDFRGTVRSEVHYARQVAERYGTVHRERQLEVERSLENLGRVVGAYDEPLADESALPTYAISEEVAQHVKVVLSGDGGDEIFGGYAWYRKAERLAGLRRALGPLAGPIMQLGRLLPSALVRQGRGWRLAHRLSLLGGATLENYFRLIGFLGAEERRRLLPETLTSRMEPDILWHLRRYWRPEQPTVRRLQLVDLQTYMPGDILVKVDRAAMHHGLEVRVPLLDHKVVESALSLPLKAVYDQGQGKRILRQVARDLVPPEIIERPKQGFGLPRAEWEENGWQDAIGQRLRGGVLRERGWIEPQGLEALLGNQQQGRNPNLVWLLLVLDLWLEQQRVC